MSMFAPKLTIIKAQVLAHADELQQGVDMALLCLTEARTFGAARVVAPIRRFDDRLTVDHSPHDQPLLELHDALVTP